MSTAADRSLALGSANPVKRRAVEEAVTRLLGREASRVACLEVASGVPDQPWGDAQTRAGAAIRATAALEAAGPGAASIGIGLEGGVALHYGRLWAFSWAVAVTAGGEEASARSAAFALPERVAGLVVRGSELGDAMDSVFGVSGSKRDRGAVGLLTGGTLSRAELYAQPALLALAPLLRPDAQPR